jgi:predicted PurR-regulated permease PerM
LLGLLAGLLYAVPVVGSLFNLCLVVLVTLVTGSPAKALMVGGALLLLTNGLFDQVITPRVLGRQVGLHPILTIIALLLGYQIWGIVGMLVAVPVAACIQTVIVHLVPKLGAHLELKPLEELQKAEAETRAEHMRVEEEPLDEHFRLQAVVENVEGTPEETAV